MTVDKAFFNSYLKRDDYGFIKDEAFNQHKTTKKHISDILTGYVEARKKEKSEEEVETKVK